MKKALITGITGQDGSFLAEFLLAKGYEVHGMIRRASTFNTERLDPSTPIRTSEGSSLHLHYGDVTDGTGLRRIIEKVRPAEIYHLAAQSHVRVSFDQPEYTADVVATGALRLFEAVRTTLRVSGEPVRIYQAGSSEMFGAAAPPQNEKHAVLSAQSVRRQQSGGALVRGELSRGVRDVHLQRHPVQSRIGAARAKPL